MFELVILELSALSAILSISATQMLLALLIVMAFAIMYKTHDFSIFKKSYTLYFIMMIAAETFSTFFGVDTANSIKSWSTFWVYLHLFAVYIVYDGKNREHIFLFFLAGTLITLGYAFYQASISHETFRPTGFFSHALTYGNVMAVLAVGAFGFLIFTPPATRRAFFINISGLLLASYCVFQSQSRGSILALLVTSFAMLIYRFRAKGIAAAAVILILGAVAVVNNPSVSGRFTEIGSDLEHGSETSIGTRLVLWEASTEAIMEKPLFGYGKGNFQKVIKPMIDVPVLSMAHAHNSYIQYTFTNGFFGLVALLLFLSALYRHLFRMTQQNPYAKTAVFILTAFLIEGLTENNFSDSEVVMATFLSIGILITPVKENPVRLFSAKKDI